MIKEFLEEYSLFRKIECQLPQTMNLLPKPPINMECRLLLIWNVEIVVLFRLLI
jgi:hypothetical protein